MATPVSANDLIRRFRVIAVLEGASFLILLGIAMPLKYLAHWPLAVKIVGWVHGALFIWFVISLWRAKRDARLSFGQSFGILVAALLPFGPFVTLYVLEVWTVTAASSHGSADHGTNVAWVV